MNNTTARLLVIFSIFFLTSSEHILAQITWPLDSIKVTASRIPTVAKESGKSISVLTQEDIQAMPVSSVDELLTSLPGVNINSRNAFGVQADIGMRGSTFSQVLVLVDGIRINDPLTAHFNNNVPVSLSEIDRIEIIRGPAATSYGADAVGGIIHIKTKTFTRRNTNSRFISGSVDGGLGENALSMTDAGVYAELNKLRLSAGIKTSISDGLEYENPNFMIGGSNSAPSTYNNYFDLQTYTISGAYQFNDSWNAYTRVGYDNRDFSAKYFYTASVYDESTEQVESWWSQVAVNRATESSQTSLNLGFRSSSDYFDFNPAFAANSHNMEQYSFSLDHGFAVQDNIKLTFGTQGLYKTIESTDRGNHENSSIGFYGIASANLIGELIGTGSLRLEYDDNFGTELLPQVSLALPLENLTLRSSFGKAIRAGDFTERFISAELETISPGRNVGNPDLEAERSYTIDLGADWTPVNGLTISNTAFFRTSNNLIDYTYTNSNNIENVTNLQSDSYYYYATNVSDSRTFGIESLIAKYFALNNNQIVRTELNYTYLHTSNDDGSVSKYVANHPIHDLSLILSFSSDRFGITTTSQLIQRNEETLSNINGSINSEYLLNHLKLDVKPFQGNDLALYVKVHNLFDIEYQEILGAQMPGRWIMAGLKWDFDNKF